MWRRERRPKKSICVLVIVVYDVKEGNQALGAKDFLEDDLGTAVIREVNLGCGSGVASGLGDFEFPFLPTPEPYGYFPGGFSLKRSVGVQLWGTSNSMSDLAFQSIG